MKTSAFALAVAFMTAATPLTPTLLAQEAATQPAAESAGEAKKERPPRGERPGRGGRPQMAGEFVANQLKLDEAQKGKLAELIRAYREASRDQNRALNEQKRAVNEAVNASPLDEITIRSEASKLATLEADAAVGRAHQLAKAKELLTPQQLEAIPTVPAFGALFGGGNPGGFGRGGRGGGPRGERGPRPEGERDQAPRRNPMIDRVAEHLKLDEAKRATLETLVQEYRKNTQPLRQNLRTEQSALQTLLLASPVDEAAIRAQSAKVSAIEADLSVAQAHQLAKAKGLLTPEQLADLKTHSPLHRLFGGPAQARQPGRPGRGREGRSPRSERPHRPATEQAPADSAPAKGDGEEG